jgi:hypothetical protein
LLDGALFVFSNGTNPEMLLILEAVQPDGDPVWRYALAPVSTAALEASLDGRAVWTAERSATPRAQRPYTYFAVPIAQATPEE